MAIELNQIFKFNSNFKNLIDIYFLIYNILNIKGFEIHDLCVYLIDVECLRF